MYDTYEASQIGRIMVPNNKESNSMKNIGQKTRWREACSQTPRGLCVKVASSLGRRGYITAG